MTTSPPSPFATMAPELLHEIFFHSLDRTPHLNLRQLSNLALVQKDWTDPARRLLYQQVHLSSPTTSSSFLSTLSQSSHSPSLGQRVKSLTITRSAFTSPSTFNDLAADDILRLCPNLLHLDSDLANFAPASDGRIGLIRYPNGLKSMRLAPTYLQSQGLYVDEEEDSDDDSMDLGTDDASTSPALRTISNLPQSVQHLKIDSQYFPSLLPQTPPSTSFPLNNVTSLELTYLKLNKTMLDWLTEGLVSNGGGGDGGGLKEVKLWMLSEVKISEIKTFLESVARGLKGLSYKARHGDAGVLMNQVIPACTTLEHLTLGQGAANHLIYPLLPSTLRTLCIALPHHHQAANMTPLLLSLGPFGNLSHSLISLSLYSGIYLPPSTTPPTFLPSSPPNTPALQSLRLSHINARPTHLTSLLTLVGPNLKLLALHHLNEPFHSLLNLSPTLRYLELGVASYPTTLPFFSLPSLHSLRLHFSSQLPLSNLHSSLSSSQKLPLLKSLDLTGFFPENVDTTNWNGKGMDELMRRCEERGTEVAMNGRGVRTLGEFWDGVVKAIQQQR